MSLPAETNVTGHAPSISQGIIGYRQLTQEEIAKMNKVKEAANALLVIIEDLMLDGTVDTRAIAIGRTHLQTGAMWVTRGIAKPTSF